MALRDLIWIPYVLMGLVLGTNLWYLARERQRVVARTVARVSVLVPARNEQRNLGRLLRSLLAQQEVDFEVVIYDDGSEDGTFAVATGTGDPRVHVLQGAGPPRGWVGKVHALYQASRAAVGDVLLFLDADTVLTHTHVLAQLVDRFGALPAHSVLTAAPRFRGGGSLLVSVVPYGMLVNLPLVLVPLVRSRFVAALNGQCWMITRADYMAHEPHLRHPAEVLEDLRIGRFLAGRGVVPHFVDLQREVEVWMYEGFGDAWLGFRKNAFLLTGGGGPAFAAYLVFYVTVFLVAPMVWPRFLIMVWVTKLISDRYARYPLWVSALAPLCFALWAGLLVDSALGHLLGRVAWKGRNVALTGDRGGRPRW